MIKKILASMTLFMVLASCSASPVPGGDASTAASNVNPQENTIMADTTPVDTASVKVAVETTAGNFTVLLYGDTPKHRDNFVKLVNSGVYGGTLFHRVIKDFMVQAGDPDSKNAQPGQHLGSGDLGYTLEAEFVYPKHFHKRGALAAARQGDMTNPQRRSSGSQFYVVTGRKFDSAQMAQLEQQGKMRMAQEHFDQLAMENMDSIRQMQQSGDTAGLKQLQTDLKQRTMAWLDEQGPALTPEQIEAYTTVGGAPHLDGQYTVFGEVIDGMDTIDKIEKAATDRADRPLDDIRIIKMSVIE